MNKSEFIASIKNGAQKGQSSYGIFASLIMAQAILESGWGGSDLSKTANNLFGIKASPNWKGRTITLPTTEWYGGKKQIINAKFRAYDTFKDSIEDHNLLLSNSRYRPVIQSEDYKEACHKIYECGYATDPAYPEKLIEIIEQNRLYDFDKDKGSGEAAVTIEGDKIRRFQHLCNLLRIKDSESNELEEDNILGPRTKSCISKMPVLKIGSNGAAVEFVQEVVGAKPFDGDFGEITKQHVIEYQKSKSIQADGIVGLQTWTVIVTT